MPTLEERENTGAAQANHDQHFCESCHLLCGMSFLISLLPVSSPLTVFVKLEMHSLNSATPNVKPPNRPRFLTLQILPHVKGLAHKFGQLHSNTWC